MSKQNNQNDQAAGNQPDIDSAESLKAALAQAEKENAALREANASLTEANARLGEQPADGKVARGEQRPAFQKLNYDGAVDVVAAGFRNERVEIKGGKACCKPGYTTDDDGYVVPEPVKVEADEAGE